MTSLVFLRAGGGFSPLLFLQVASAERLCVSLWGRRDLWAQGQLECRYDVRCVLTQLAECYKPGFLRDLHGFQMFTV